MSQPEFRLGVTLEASVALSEDVGKVRAALVNVVGDSRYTVEEGPGLVRITSDDPRCIRQLHDQLRDRHVRATARKLLVAGREGSRSTVTLNRQAATAGVIALCGSEAESALGPIYLTLKSDELDAIIEWLTAYEGGYSTSNFMPS